MDIVARMLGGLLLIYWAINLVVGRMHFVRTGAIGHATLFLHCVLPLLMGIGMLMWGNIWVLPVGGAIAVLAFFFQWFFLHIFPLAVGWAFGQMLFEDWGLSAGSKFWPYLGGLAGAVTAFIACTIIVGYITCLPRDSNGR